jgi:hypothetical protein
MREFPARTYTEKQRMRFPIVLLACLCAAAQVPQPKAQPSGATRQLMNSINADALRGHVSFLASDLLEGRATPSRGLDIAAEYIASQFRGAGLEAAGDQGYFQTAELEATRPATEGLTITVEHAGRTVMVSGDDVSPGSEIYEGFTVEGASAVKVPFGGEPLPPREEIEGKVVLTRFRAGRDVPESERAQWYAGVSAFRNALRPLKPALVINVNPNATRRAAPSSGYADAQQRAKALRSLTASGKEFAELYDSLPAGPADVRVSVSIPELEARRLTGRNVIGLVRGGDARLQDTYVLLSCHYDHIGTRAEGADRIYNGANDDASGTAALIELARAFSSLRPAPRRSIVFVAYFGEEIGLVGSKYYANHPVFPLDRTVVNINLEHLGRTDDNMGSQTGRAALIGFDYSDVGETLQRAGAVTGYEIYNRKGNEMYFDRSDHAPLAEAGVPAHTLAVTFEFPDYHGPGDEWPKLNYLNMERVVDTVAVGTLAVANRSAAPRWNVANEKARRYREAHRAPESGL